MACVQDIGINKCIVYISLSIIGRLVGVLGGSGFLHCLVGWLGVTAVRCYGRAFLSKMYPVAAAGILWRRVSFVVLVCEEGVWLPWCNWDVFNVVHSRCWCPLCHVI